jgi:hypothetical protein
MSAHLTMADQELQQMHREVLELSRRVLVAVHHLGDRIVSALTDLQAQVAQNASVEQSAVLLIQGLATQLSAAIGSDNGAALMSLSQQLNASATALAAAITANTPAATPATPATPAAPTTPSTPDTPTTPEPPASPAAAANGATTAPQAPSA